MQLLLDGIALAAQGGSCSASDSVYSFTCCM